MGKLEKYVIGEAGVRNLIYGIIAISIAITLIFSFYAMLWGRFANIERTIRLSRWEIHSWIRYDLYFPLAMLFIGVLGGLQLGRYVQTEFDKIRKKRMKSE